jgi:hypothetical protein
VLCGTRATPTIVLSALLNIEGDDAMAPDSVFVDVITCVLSWDAHHVRGRPRALNARGVRSRSQNVTRENFP